MLSCRAAAEAWEAAFVELARTQLSVMAASAGLRLSFSSERSVADELARESYADVSTVRMCSHPSPHMPLHPPGLLPDINEPPSGIQHTGQSQGSAERVWPCREPALASPLIKCC